MPYEMTYVSSEVIRLDTVTLVVLVITVRARSKLKASNPEFAAKYIRGCVSDANQGFQHRSKNLLTCASSGSCETPGSVQLCQIASVEGARGIAMSRV